MTKRPEVSVILPTFNRAGTLGPAITSVLHQAGAVVDLVVVDDASTDATNAVLEAFTSAALRVVRLPVNTGPAGARNAGAAAARAPLLAFQDSDDIWTQGRLVAQVEQLRNAPPTVAVSYGRVRKLLPAGRSMVHPGRSQRQVAGDLLRPLAHGNFIGLPTAIVSREAFEAVGGFDERLRCLEDWELWLRLAKKYRFAFIDRVVVEAASSVDGVNSSASDALNALDVIARQHAGVFDGAGRANLHYLRGDALVRLGRGGRARREFMRAIVEQPDRAKAWYALIASTTGQEGYVRMKSWAARMRHGR